MRCEKLFYLVFGQLLGAIDQFFRQGQLPQSLLVQDSFLVQRYFRRPALVRKEERAWLAKIQNSLGRFVFQRRGRYLVINPAEIQ